MDGEVAGMPKFQLIRDFFWDLEGPYKVLALDDKGKAERVERIKALHGAATFEEYKPIIAEFIKYARIREVRRYQLGVEVVKYDVWSHTTLVEGWNGPYLIDVKYGQDGELVSYTFDPDEEVPFEVTATLVFDKETIETNRVEDILEFCCNMEFNTGMFLEEENGNAMIYVWNFGSEESPSFDLVWEWGGYEQLRMSASVTSRKSMVDFVKRYIRGGLSNAQTGLEWTPVYMMPVQH